MERAHYIQERSLPELRDFLEKKIFSKDEVRQIVKKRTTFEAALIRRVARRSDFLKYIAYEMSLEALRRKRVKRLHLGGGPPSISDFALVRKQFFIFERAVAKFKSDLGLWVQYIQLAKKEGAKGLASRICARALQLHPTAPVLFIVASAHELDQSSPTAARSLLQRGLRLNPESLALWTEYVKMELTYVETLRRRWAVLGINSASKEAAKGHDDSDESRQLVMNGAIVVAVVENAVKALPQIELFKSLQSLIQTFPMPIPLRKTILDALDSHLSHTLPHNAEACMLHATRDLSLDLEGEELVDALRKANSSILSQILATQSALRTSRRDLVNAYTSWLSEWVHRIDEDNLRQYLILSLQSLPAKLSKDDLTSSLLANVISLSSSTSTSSTSTPTPTSEKAIKLARRYTTDVKYQPVGSSPQVWLARLTAEQGNPSSSASARTKHALDVWKEAQSNSRLSPGENSQENLQSLKDLWLWGVPNRGAISEHSDTRVIFDDILVRSQTLHESSIHDAVLVRYLQNFHPNIAPYSAPTKRSPKPSYPRRDNLSHLLASGKARPGIGFWPLAFELEASLLSPDDDAITDELEISGEASADDLIKRRIIRKQNVEGVGAMLETLYARWRNAGSDGEVEAGLKYGEWLLCIADDGVSATKVIRTAIASCSSRPGLRDEVEGRWAKVLAKKEEAEAVVDLREEDFGVDEGIVS